MKVKNPVEALIFFRLLSSNCVNWTSYCGDHSSLSSTTAVQYEFHIYFTSLFIYVVHSKVFSGYKCMIQKISDKQFITCSLPFIWICKENYGYIYRSITFLNKQLHIKKFHEKAKLNKLHNYNQY